MVKKIKLEKTIENVGEKVNIVDDINVKLLIMDKDNKYARPYNLISKNEYNPLYDDKNFGEKWPTSYYIKSDDNDIIVVYKGAPYISGGYADVETYQENLKNQQKDINYINDHLSDLILNDIERNKEQNKLLEEAINSVITFVPNERDIEKLIAEEKDIPLPCGGNIKIIYNAEDEKRWPSLYIIEDKNNDFVSLKIRKKWYKQGLENNDQNIKNQNNDIKDIFLNIKDILKDKINMNLSDNQKLEKTLNVLKKNNHSFGYSTPTL